MVVVSFVAEPNCSRLNECHRVHDDDTNDQDGHLERHRGGDSDDRAVGPGLGESKVRADTNSSMIALRLAA